ncbi:hypothetical protein HN446_01620 [bacterium]|jgi:hypothetical protein|nr:hypothetical protein [bacterium]
MNKFFIIFSALLCNFIFVCGCAEKTIVHTSKLIHPTIKAAQERLSEQIGEVIVTKRFNILSDEFSAKKAKAKAEKEAKKQAEREDLDQWLEENGCTFVKEFETEKKH